MASNIFKSALGAKKGRTFLWIFLFFLAFEILFARQWFDVSLFGFKNIIALINGVLLILLAIDVKTDSL